MRTNKHTDIVFQDILTNNVRIGKLDKFLSAGSPTDIYMEKYQELINKNMKTLVELSDLEEIILQMRAWDNLGRDDMKVTVANDYIYVRATFYRADKVAKEIRTIVGKIEEWNINDINDINNILDNPEFITQAITKLAEAMLDVIHINNDAYAEKYKTKIKV